MDSHSVNGLVRRETGRQHAAHLVVYRPKKDTHLILEFWVREGHADVAVEEFHVVIISNNHHGTTAIPLIYLLQKSRLRENLLDQLIQLQDAIRSVPQGTEHLEIGEAVESLCRVVRLEIALITLESDFTELGA